MWDVEIGAEALDEIWDKLVLGAIGETIDPGDEITGVRVIHKVRRAMASYVHACGSGSHDSLAVLLPLSV